MPCALIAPISTSLLPAVTASLTLNKSQEVRSTEESAARITGLLAAPCAIGLAVMAEPVMVLLGSYSGEKLVLATQMMTMMGIMVLLYALVMLTNVLLQARGRVHVPVIHTLICGSVKLGSLYILTGNPAIGILGVPISGLLCYLGILILNLIALRMHGSERSRLLPNLLRPMIPALIMGVIVYGCLWALKVPAGISSSLVLCAVPIAVGVVVYALCAVFLKVITREDCLLLPQGEKIAKLLRL
jgi:stage V sporulation protein B